MQNHNASIATYTQPDPIPNDDQAVVDVLVEELSQWADDRWGHPIAGKLLIQDLQSRKQLGIERYGTALQYNNGRSPLIDAYQEILDAIVYLEQSGEYLLRDDAIFLALRLRPLAQQEFDRIIP